MKLTQERIAIEKLLVDPNNPRYFDIKTHKEVDAKRYAEETIQEAARGKLALHYGIDDIRKSILRNGFVPFEAIVAKPYEHAEGYYVVIEGNRRVAAIHSIYYDFVHGQLTDYDLPEEVVKSFEELDVLVFSGEPAEEQVLQGMRHVAGPMGWKPYQQARLVTNLHEEHGQSFDVIQKSLGLRGSTSTITRRLYDTFKAFQQMRGDEDYGNRANRDLFSLFEEVVRKPVLRNWLGWSDDSRSFLNEQNRRSLYSLIVPEEGEDDERETNEGKLSISNPQDMRDFAKIVGHEKRDRVLERVVQGELTIQQALAKIDPGDASWEDVVGRCGEVLDGISADVLEEFQDEQIGLLTQLRDALVKKLEQISKLKDDN